MKTIKFAIRIISLSIASFHSLMTIQAYFQRYFYCLNFKNCGSNKMIQVITTKKNQSVFINSELFIRCPNIYTYDLTHFFNIIFSKTISHVQKYIIIMLLKTSLYLNLLFLNFGLLWQETCFCFLVFKYTLVIF